MHNSETPLQTLVATLITSKVVITFTTLVANSVNNANCYVSNVKSYANNVNNVTSYVDNVNDVNSVDIIVPFAKDLGAGTKCLGPCARTSA